MPKRRRLGDLYVTGRSVKINDESGLDPVEVWLQKLSPIEQENALRRSSVERAKYLAVVNDHESEIWQSVWADLHEFAPLKEQLLPLALRDDLMKARARIEAEVADEDEWKKDGYLQSLMDAWEGTVSATASSLIDAVLAEADAVEAAAVAEESEVTNEPVITPENADGEQEPLKVSFLRDHDDPRWEKAAAVEKELRRYTDACEAAWTGERDRILSDYDDVPLEQVRDMAVEKTIEMNASTAMLTEFETQELFYATRDPDNHAKKYFGTRDEVLSLQPTVRRRLVDEYRLLNVAPDQGKGLPGIPGSSQPSDSSEPEATPTSSGPEA